MGAGPAGMMAAGYAAKRGLNTVLIEKNSRPGRKLMITGKGRCNLTNNCDLQTLIASVPTNGRFLYSAFSRFTPQDTMALFNELGVSVKTERGNRVFPLSDKAVDIVDAMVRFIKISGCTVRQGRAEHLLIEGNAVKGVALDNGQSIHAGAVILATGGASYPLTGSTGDGYELARQAGHTVTELSPSLVPLVSKDSWCKDLQGLSLKNISIRVLDKQKDKPIYEDFGEMLFTHFGLSGPVILSASAHMRHMAPERYRVEIDLKPALSPEQLDARLQRDFTQYANRDFDNALAELLPHKLIPVFVRLSGLAPQMKCNQITKDMRRGLVQLLKELPVTIKGFRPIEEAIITSGGVKVSEINPKTMESKLVKGLYFSGEIIDADAYTGGFNLQIAFSTGYCAGNSVLEGKL